MIALRADHRWRKRIIDVFAHLAGDRRAEYRSPQVGDHLVNVDMDGDVDVDLDGDGNVEVAVHALTGAEDATSASQWPIGRAC